MTQISLYKGTLPHEAEAKVGGARILLKPASQGTGLIAGGVVRTVLEVTGVHNALSKSLGSTNKANTAYATIEALKQLTPAKNWITRQGAPAKAASAKVEAKAPAKKPAAKKSTAKAAKSEAK